MRDSSKGHTEMITRESLLYQLLSVNLDWNLFLLPTPFFSIIENSLSSVHIPQGGSSPILCACHQESTLCGWPIHYVTILFSWPGEFRVCVVESTSSEPLSLQILPPRHVCVGFPRSWFLIEDTGGRRISPS